MFCFEKSMNTVSLFSQRGTCSHLKHTIHTPHPYTFSPQVYLHTQSHIIERALATRLRSEWFHTTLPRATWHVPMGVTRCDTVFECVHHFEVAVSTHLRFRSNKPVPSCMRVSVVSVTSPQRLWWGKSRRWKWRKQCYSWVHLECSVVYGRVVCSPVTHPR